MKKNLLMEKYTFVLIIVVILSILFYFIYMVFIVMLLWEAIERIRNPVEINGKLMFIISCIGLIVNLCMLMYYIQIHINL